MFLPFRQRPSGSEVHHGPSFNSHSLRHTKNPLHRLRRLVSCLWHLLLGLIGGREFLCGALFLCVDDLRSLKLPYGFGADESRIVFGADGKGVERGSAGDRSSRGSLPRRWEQMTAHSATRQLSQLIRNFEARRCTGGPRELRASAARRLDLFLSVA